MITFREFIENCEVSYNYGTVLLSYTPDSYIGIEVDPTTERIVGNDGVYSPTELEAEEVIEMVRDFVFMQEGGEEDTYFHETPYDPRTANNW